jgi:uncharacterized membrane protein YqjE
VALEIHQTQVRLEAVELQHSVHRLLAMAVRLVLKILVIMHLAVAARAAIYQTSVAAMGKAG